MGNCKPIGTVCLTEAYPEGVALGDSITGARITRAVSISAAKLLSVQDNNSPPRAAVRLSVSKSSREIMAPEDSVSPA